MSVCEFRGRNSLFGFAILALSLASCGEGEAEKKANKAKSGQGGSSGIVIATESGDPIPAEGTWTVCYFPGANEREQHTFTGTSLTIQYFTGTSGGATCTAGTLDSSRSGNLTVGSTGSVAFVNWLDGSGNVSSGPGGLNPGTLTTMNVSGTFGGSPLTATFTYWVDDRSANKYLYRGDNSGNCLQQSGVDVCLADSDELTLQ